LRGVDERGRPWSERTALLSTSLQAGHGC
jgi:hypothetical protein